MPKGVETVVDGGFATIDFIDVSQRAAGLNKLLEIGGPESIETITRQGPRRKYRVPEGNAREAGLLDKASKQESTAKGDTGFAADLQAAHEQQAQEGNRPDVLTSKGNTYRGESSADEVNAAAGSPATTVKGGPGVGGLTSTPTHDEVIAHVTEQRVVPEYVPDREPLAQSLNAGLAHDPGDPRWAQTNQPDQTPAPQPPQDKAPAKKAPAKKAAPKKTEDKS